MKLRNSAPIRKIENEISRIYLTFDDGPDPQTTPVVLEVLKSTKTKATFFLIASKAAQYPELVRRIVDDGHAIGNHSFDHRFGIFFKGRKAMLDWVDSSIASFKAMGIETVGFRPPNGVVTPKLRWALRQRRIPLVLWNIRCFDTVLPWRESRALRSLKRTKAGAIVLLHDRMPVARLAQFTGTLHRYIKGARNSGFEFERLTAEVCRKQIGDSTD